MFSKILVANRGEIAVRIIRACKEMGISTVSIFSEADREALHVSLADESYCVGGPLSKDSYLNMDSIISTAIATNSEAIHPGYGFLAENPEFAAKCATNNLIFIGPSEEIIKKMGDKDKAKKTMREANVPVIPGCDNVSSIQKAKKEAKKIGFPLLIKASAGGGGRGIRLVNNMEEFENCFNAASTEAQAAFGDKSLYLEKYLDSVKHIEMQIIADNFGHVLCLGERDCSIQRKNQKIIEETPATILTPEIRKRMIDISIKAGKAASYRGVGTIEYLYDRSGNFYFMEMNTRLQVEHPITEAVTWIDLVKWQIRIAAGMKLTFNQKQIEFKGHAIECRINAEDPYQNFKSSCGKIELLHIPGGPWVRFDTAIYQGYSIPPFYDSLVGKLIVFAKTRDEAIRKMKSALCELIIEGVETNTELHMEILAAEDFENATYTTDFLEDFLS